MSSCLDSRRSCGARQFAASCETFAQAVATLPPALAPSILSAVSADGIKVPTERGTLPHVQWFRELVDRKILTRLTWADTRDMVADGMGKGAVDRRAIVEFMSGHWTQKHAEMSWPTR